MSLFTLTVWYRHRNARKLRKCSKENAVLNLQRILPSEPKRKMKVRERQQLLRITGSWLINGFNTTQISCPPSLDPFTILFPAQGQALLSEGEIYESALVVNPEATVLLRTAVWGWCISSFDSRKDTTLVERSNREAHQVPCILNGVCSFQIHSWGGSTAGEEEDGAVAGWSGSYQGVYEDPKHWGLNSIP